IKCSSRLRGYLQIRTVGTAWRIDPEPLDGPCIAGDDRSVGEMRRTSSGPAAVAGSMSAPDQCGGEMAEVGEGVARVVSTDGTEIAYRSTGQEPPLVLVHGGPADHTRWQPLLPFLEPVVTVLAMDRRGRGASADGPEYRLA